MNHAVLFTQPQNSNPSQFLPETPKNPFFLTILKSKNYYDILKNIDSELGFKMTVISLTEHIFSPENPKIKKNVLMNCVLRT